METLTETVARLTTEVDRLTQRDCEARMKLRTIETARDELLQAAEMIEAQIEILSLSMARLCRLIHAARPLIELGKCEGTRLN